MKGFIICLSVVIGLVIAGVDAMDQEWLSDEFFDNRYGVCVKMRAFSVEDKL